MFKICDEKIDPIALASPLTNSRAGAYCSFEGWVRNHNENKSVSLLEYEAYEALCINEADKIIAETKEQFDVIDVHCVHRVGALSIGDIAVWVGVTAEHRADAFAACRHVIDEIKSRLPIWKRETYTDGRTEWVNCQSHTHTHTHKTKQAHDTDPASIAAVAPTSSSASNEQTTKPETDPARISVVAPTSASSDRKTQKTDSHKTDPVHVPALRD